MFIVGKLFTYTLLPPGSIVIALAVVAILLLRRKRIGESITLFAISGLMYLASIQPMSNLLLAPLEGASIGVQSTRQPELIVVLGGGAIPARFATTAQDVAKSDAPPDLRAVEPATASATFRILTGDSIARTSEGAALHLATGLPVGVTGGSPLTPGLEPEAVAAKRYLERLGVPSGAILVEGVSKNTWENAKLVADLSDSRSIYLITSAYHMKRSIECFAAFGFEVTPRATDFRVSSGGYTFWDFAPSSPSFSDSIQALHEDVGRFYYRLRYGSGGYRFLGGESTTPQQAAGYVGSGRNR